MKKIFTLILLSGLFIQSQAQTASAVVYSEMGEKFTLYLNSEPQNDQPQSNVKVKNLTAEFYQARIDFEDAKLADFANNNFAVQKGLEVTYVVKKNKKGEYVLRYHGEAAMGGSTATANPTPAHEDAKRIADVHTEEAVETMDAEETVEVVEIAQPVDPESGNVDLQISLTAPQTETVNVKTNVGTTTTTKTTTTTTAKPAPKTTTTQSGTTNTENVSMGINVGGVNMGVNFKVEETTTGGDVNMDMNVEETQTTTTTRTTTTGTPAPAKTVTPSKPAAPAKPTTPAPAPAREEVVIVDRVAGCTIPMNSTDFAKAKNNIAGKNFEDQKLSTAKTIAKTNCLSSEQIKDICGTFNFEDSKLDFAKYAYDYCSDKGNYYIINDVFNFSSSSDELEQFISSK